MTAGGLFRSNSKRKPNERHFTHDDQVSELLVWDGVPPMFSFDDPELRKRIAKGSGDEVKIHLTERRG